MRLADPSYVEIGKAACGDREAILDNMFALALESSSDEEKEGEELATSHPEEEEEHPSQAHVTV